MLDFEAARRDRALTQQQAADDLGVPRTTLLDQAARAAATPLPPRAQRAFFESPDGVQFLRVLLTAALFAMNLAGGLRGRDGPGEKASWEGGVRDLAANR